MSPQPVASMVASASIVIAPIDPTAQLAYYCAAMTGLSFVEAKSPTRRRFGPDADALWKEVKGHLCTADRLDLLLRDADAQWPGAFSARGVFALRAVAEDEPFGADFRSLDDVDAEELWRSVTRADPPAGIDRAIEACARAWGLTLAPCDPGPIAPATKLLVVGPSAIAATAVTFAAGADLAWPDQVTCVAAEPAHRQLAAIAGALLNTTRPTRIVDPRVEATAALGARLDRLVHSRDASAADLDWAQRVMAEAR